MALNKDQETLYKKTMDDVKLQLDSIDSEVERELQKVRERLAQLQESKKSLKMVYEGMAKLLGIELETDENRRGLGHTQDVSVRGRPGPPRPRGRSGRRLIAVPPSAINSLPSRRKLVHSCIFSSAWLSASWPRSPGSVNVFVISQALKRDFSHGFLAGMTTAFLDAVFCFVALAGILHFDIPRIRASTPC
jgi:hypothetical protein